jgi:cell shape-determining protein MreC
VAQTQARHAAEAKLDKTERELATTVSNFKQTRAALEATTTERDQAVAGRSAEKARAEKLGSQLAEKSHKLTETQEYLARYKSAGLEPEEIVNVRDELKAMHTSLASVQEENQKLKGDVKRLASIWSDVQCRPVALPADLSAKVLITDPKWRFVILNVGEKQGVLERGEVLLSRHGKLIARAKITSVQAERCVANLMPGWDIGQVVEGDVAMAAPPRS